MDVSEAIRARRSVKNFTNRPVSSAEIEQLLDAAVRAPNHRHTEPWRFYVLGPHARRAYGEALGARKARRVDDPDAARAVRDKVADTHERLPALIAVAMVQDDNPEIREEDYAAVFMGLQNLALEAVSLGLATHLKTGAVMDDPAARGAVGVAEGERIVALVEVGQPEAARQAPERAPATERTTYRD